MAVNVYFATNRKVSGGAKPEIGEDFHDNPPKVFRIIWGMGEGLVAAVLLLAGGLGALQTASIAAAFPISFVLLAMTWGLLKSLSTDPSAAPLGERKIAPDGTRITQELHA